MESRCRAPSSLKEIAILFTQNLDGARNATESDILKWFIEMSPHHFFASSRAVLSFRSLLFVSTVFFVQVRTRANLSLSNTSAVLDAAESSRFLCFRKAFWITLTHTHTQNTHTHIHVPVPSLSVIMTYALKRVSVYPSTYIKLSMGLIVTNYVHVPRKTNKNRTFPKTYYMYISYYLWYAWLCCAAVQCAHIFVGSSSSNNWMEASICRLPKWEIRRSTRSERATLRRRGGTMGMNWCREKNTWEKCSKRVRSRN